MADTPPADIEIEGVAEALYGNRHEKSNGPWSEFKERKPDIATIYRENAQVAINALDRIRGRSHGRNTLAH